MGNYFISLELNACLTNFAKPSFSHRMYYCYSSVKVFGRIEGCSHFHYILVKGPI